MWEQKKDMPNCGKNQTLIAKKAYMIANNNMNPISAYSAYNENVTAKPLLQLTLLCQP
jgi:hypothetical protein